MRTPYVAGLTAVTLSAATLAIAPLGTPAVAAPAAAAATTVRAPAASTVRWGSCDDAWLSYYGAKCAHVAIPLNYHHPGGRKIKIAISRVRHTSSAADYKGAILVNPGGPGGSGLGMSTLGDSVPHGAGNAYDWIGFDPRGVGSSQPSLHCIPNYFHMNRPDYRPRTKALVSTWKHRARRYADRCAEKRPGLIKHLTTAEVARDMNRIRRALGLKKISFYGFSYGTYLGSVFATLFPSHLKRMVLDSTVDPRRVWYDANLDQDVAFDRNINIWFSWVAKYHDNYRLGSTRKAVRRHWYDALHELARHPAGGKLGPAEWSDTFLYAGYYRNTWLQLGRLFSRYVHGGHWRDVASFYRNYTDTQDDNGYAVYLGVQCTDAPWPQHWSRWQHDSNQIAADAPFLTWANTWFNAPCLYWHARARNHPVQVDGSHVGKVLMIDEKLDAATPYEGSLTTRRLFPNAVLVAEPGGTTHADSLSGDSCVDNLIAKYLGSGDLPPRRDGDRADVTCQPLPDPVPSRAASRSGPAAPAVIAPSVGTGLRPTLPAVARRAR